MTSLATLAPLPHAEWRAASLPSTGGVMRTAVVLRYRQMV